MLSEEALVKAVKRALLSQSDDGMVKDLLVIHEREMLSQRFDAINKTTIFSGSFSNSITIGSFESC